MDSKVDAVDVKKADVAKIVRELEAVEKEKAKPPVPKKVSKPVKKNAANVFDTSSSSDGEDDDDRPPRASREEEGRPRSLLPRRGRPTVEADESGSNDKEIAKPAKQTPPATSAFSPVIIGQVLATHEGILKQGKDLSGRRHEGPHRSAEAHVRDGVNLFGGVT